MSGPWLSDFGSVHLNRGSVPNPNEVAFWVSVDEISADSNFTWDGLTLKATVIEAQNQLTVVGLVPRLRLEEAGVSLDQSKWEYRAQSEALEFQILDDLTANVVTWLEVQRSGTGASIQVDTISLTCVNGFTVDSDLAVTGNVGITGAITNTDYVQFDLAFADGTAEGRLQWNTEDGTLEVGMPGGNVNLQIGQEMLIRVRNTTGVTIPNGSVVYIDGAQGVRPTIALAKADVDATAHIAGIVTEDIADNTTGYVNISGFVREVDTSGMAAGDSLYLSDSVAGAFTNIIPIGNSHISQVGTVVVVHATEGVILHHQEHNPHLTDLSGVEDAILLDGEMMRWVEASSQFEFFTLTETDIENLSDQLDITRSLMLDHPAVVASSDGVTITLSLEQKGGGDLRVRWSDGVDTYDTTPATTIALTAGTDRVPVLNYIYMLQSTKELAVSAIGWPAVEYTAVAQVLCQTAASAQTDGLYMVQAWTEHTSNAINGHIAMLNFWVRHQSATWLSGVAPGVTAGVMQFDINTTVGEILQLHPHSFPAFDTSTGSHVLVPNDSVSAFAKVSDPTTILIDALGGSLSNRYFNLILIGSVSEASGDSQLLINLPEGSYTNSANAQADVDETAIYTIPESFRGTGFLVARLTVRHQVGGGGTWTDVLVTDLRAPANAGAGSSGVGLTKADADLLYLSLLGGTVTGPVVLTDTFTSLGIDDNATKEVLQLADISMALGDASSGNQYVIRTRAVTDGSILYTGDNNAKGGQIEVYGTTHAKGGDLEFKSSDNIWMHWDESVGDLEISTGVGVKTTALTIDASQKSTFAGDVTVQGAFTSLGIDDNATGERMQIGNVALSLGTTGASYSIIRQDTNQSLSLFGGTSGDGGNIVLHGSTHANAGDVYFQSSNATWMFWDESVGDLEIKTGVGAKTTALNIDANQLATFAGAVTVQGSFTSLGIDDNATGERFQLADTKLTIGASDTAFYEFVRALNTGGLLISGGSASVTGANLVLAGGTHLTIPSDFALRADANSVVGWDESAGVFTISTGVGAKTDALIIDADQNLTGIVGDIILTEKADHTATSVAGKGQIWHKNTAPSTLIFTDDAGTDWTLNQIAGNGNQHQGRVLTTSGTSHLVSSIPSWVTKIYIMFNGVSTTTTGIPMIQIGYSGGLKTTGYSGDVIVWSGTGSALSTGFRLTSIGGAGIAYQGHAVLSLGDETTNTWTWSSLNGPVGQGGTSSAGQVSLSGPLDRLALLIDAAGSFDAGSFTVNWS